MLDFFSHMETEQSTPISNQYKLAPEQICIVLIWDIVGLSQLQ